MLQLILRIRARSENAPYISLILLYKNSLLYKSSNYIIIMNSVTEFFKFVFSELRYNFHGLAYIHWVMARIINKEPIAGCPEGQVIMYCSQKGYRTGQILDCNEGYQTCVNYYQRLQDIYNFELSCNCYKCRATIKYLIYAVLRISDILNLDILESCNLVLRSD